MKNTVFWRLIALALALVLALGCFAACAKEEEKPTGTTEPAGTDPAKPADPALEPVEEYSLGGLHFRLPAGAEVTDELENEYAYYACGDLVINVSILSKTAMSISAETVQELVDFYQESLAVVFAEVSTVEENGMPLLVMSDSGEQYVIGIYTSGDFYWMLEVCGKTKDASVDDMAKIAATGTVVESELPEPAISYTKTLECSGLVLQMEQEYQVDGNGSAYVWAESGEVIVTMNRFDGIGQTSQELLEVSEENLQGIYNNIQLVDNGGKPYLLLQDDDGYTDVMVIYTSDYYYWEITAGGFIDEATKDSLIASLTAPTFE